MVEQRDIPGCREIYNYYVKNTSFSLEETELTADRYEARVAGVTERFPFLVARDDAGNVAGFAYLSDFNPRSGSRHTADLSIYTAPDLRGVGLGAALLHNSKRDQYRKAAKGGDAKSRRRSGRARPCFKKHGEQRP